VTVVVSGAVVGAFDAVVSVVGVPVAVAVIVVVVVRFVGVATFGRNTVRPGVFVVITAASVVEPSSSSAEPDPDRSVAGASVVVMLVVAVVPKFAPAVVVAGQTPHVAGQASRIFCPKMGW